MPIDTGCNLNYYLMTRVLCIFKGKNSDISKEVKGKKERERERKGTRGGGLRRASDGENPKV